MLRTRWLIFSNVDGLGTIFSRRANRRAQQGARKWAAQDAANGNNVSKGIRRSILWSLITNGTTEKNHLAVTVKHVSLQTVNLCQDEI